MVDKIPKILAVIPARGGSKRIPDKNIIDFAGKPMIAHTIEAAIKAGIFQRIIVSTDTLEIAQVAEKYGADVPFFRQKFNDDYSTVSQVTINCLNILKERFDEVYDIVIQLLPNCPLRKSEHIVEAYKKFFTNSYNFQISVFEYGWMNPWWAHTMDEQGTGRIIMKTVDKNTRSQDLSKTYCPTGAIWIANTIKLLEAGTFYGNGYKLYPLSWKSAVDIDNYDDLEMAEFLFKWQNPS